MKCLVTGAGGFVGAHLCDELYRRGYLVSAVVRGAVLHNKNIEFKQISSIAEDTDWRGYLKDVDVVVHLAARVHMLNHNNSDASDAYKKLNTDSTLNFARQAAAAGIKRFVYISTIKVNGERTLPGRPFTSGDAPNPSDDYGVSKLEAENGLLEIAAKTGLEVVVIRPVLVYGPGVKANFMSMLRWLHGGLPLPFGAINNKRSLISIYNLVDLIILCINHPAATNKIFLASDGEDLSTTELLRRTSLALGIKPKLWPIPQKLLKFVLTSIGKHGVAQRLCDSLQVDINKTREILDWKPIMSVDEGLRLTAQNYIEKVK